MNLPAFLYKYRVLLRSPYATGVAAFSVLCVGILLFSAPLEKDAFYPQVFVVSKGESIRSVAESLRERHLISSPSLFILVNYAVGGKILYGSYHFSEPKGMLSRARELYFGENNTLLHRVIIPEGSNLYDIADVFEDRFPAFNREKFEADALEKHGYLYPDTYFLANDDIQRTDQIIDIMTETFNSRAGDLLATYRGDFSRNEIITLASIVELEAHRQDDRRRIAGVLFNRLEQGLPLQVDVSFLFISGKDTFDLSRTDLSTSDPSNTYKYRGIPPIPITNPSREAIEAVLDPIPSDDLFFLADFYGTTHFSETYEEHLRKKYKYIDRVKNSITKKKQEE